MEAVPYQEPWETVEPDKGYHELLDRKMGDPPDYAQASMGVITDQLPPILAYLDNLGLKLCQNLVWNFKGNIRLLLGRSSDDSDKAQSIVDVSIRDEVLCFEPFNHTITERKHPNSGDALARLESIVDPETLFTTIWRPNLACEMVRTIQILLCAIRNLFAIWGNESLRREVFGDKYSLQLLAADFGIQGVFIPNQKPIRTNGLYSVSIGLPSHLNDGGIEARKVFYTQWKERHLPDVPLRIFRVIDSNQLELIENIF